eukprot:CAMPEP_0198328620 /NCGR_PEP_ID=MMETSP1450-20131203/15588_1 /TAXON_ID=753684 ORGANISM="Madagascaria erythrocladiodes, Strain CCMP3234" /NCGR_SAMPLE_ID=MMETSP1450 /ASSEMBLY_ACC=CAM_ASM_001115 /LENGTH=126 /DNA_ID=CAMNT_0044032767 /DNA_START=453 /DNA_END=834 /DNA_ORIENTATION=-
MLEAYLSYRVTRASPEIFVEPKSIPVKYMSHTEEENDDTEERSSRVDVMSIAHICNSATTPILPPVSAVAADVPVITEESGERALPVYEALARHLTPQPQQQEDPQEAESESYARVPRVPLRAQGV